MPSSAFAAEEAEEAEGATGRSSTRSRSSLNSWTLSVCKRGAQRQDLVLRRGSRRSSQASFASLVLQTLPGIRLLGYGSHRVKDKPTQRREIRGGKTSDAVNHQPSPTVNCHQPSSVSFQSRSWARWLSGKNASIMGSNGPVLMDLNPNASITGSNGLEPECSRQTYGGSPKLSLKEYQRDRTEFTPDLS